MPNQGTIPLENNLIRKGFGPDIPYNVYNFSKSTSGGPTLTLFDIFNDVYESPVRIEDDTGYLELVEGETCVSIPEGTGVGTCDFGFTIEATYSPTTSPTIGPLHTTAGYIEPIEGQTVCQIFFDNHEIPVIFSEDFPDYLIRKLVFRSNVETSCAFPEDPTITISGTVYWLPKDAPA